MKALIERLDAQISIRENVANMKDDNIVNHPLQIPVSDAKTILSLLKRVEEMNELKIIEVSNEAAIHDEEDYADGAKWLLSYIKGE